MAVQVLNPVAAHIMDYATHFRVVPWVAVPPYVGKTLAEAQLRKFAINVLGYFRGASLKPDPKPQMHFPVADYRIAEKDTLLLVGEDDAIERFLGSLDT
jgi:Trk K+ transport system NAD-binding subunit